MTYKTLQQGSFIATKKFENKYMKLNHERVISYFLDIIMELFKPKQDKREIEKVGLIHF